MIPTFRLAMMTVPSASCPTVSGTEPHRNCWSSLSQVAPITVRSCSDDAPMMASASASLSTIRVSNYVSLRVDPARPATAWQRPAALPTHQSTTLVVGILPSGRQPAVSPA